MIFQAYYWRCCPCCCPCKGIKFRSFERLGCTVLLEPGRRSYRDNKYRIGALVIPSLRILFVYIQDSLSIFLILTNFVFPGDSFVPVLVIRSRKLLLGRSYMEFQFDVRISSSPRQDNQNNGQIGWRHVLPCLNSF